MAKIIILSDGRNFSANKINIEGDLLDADDNILQSNTGTTFEPVEDIELCEQIQNKIEE